MKMLNKIIGGSIGIAAVLAFSASTTQAQLVNGAFDLSGPGNWTANPITLATVNQGWATFGNAGQNDMSSSPDSPLSFPYALLEVNGVGNNWNPAGAYQIDGNVVVGTTYTFTMNMLTDTGTHYATPVDLSIGFRTSTLTTNGMTGPGSIGGGSFSAAFNPGTNVWNTASVSATAPAGAQYVIVYAMFMDNGQTIAENVYFDNGSLTPDLMPVPEPSSLALLGMGLAIPFYFIRRRKS